jgi:two-component system sensor histidine kinase HydH
MRTLVSPQHVLDLVIWAGHFAVGILVLLQPVRSPLVRPMVAIAFNFFGWSFADFAFQISGRPQWHWLDLGQSPFATSLALQVIGTFTGLTSTRRATLAVFYFWSLALASVAWLAFVWPPARGWVASKQWFAVFLVMVLAAVAVSVTWLLLHARRVREHDERARTRTILVGMVVAGALGATDFLKELGLPVPAVANVGSLFASVVLAIATLRLKFLGRNLPVRLAVLAGVLAAGGAVGYVGLFRGLSGNTAALMVGTSTLTLVLVVAVRQIAAAHLRRRDRTDALARLGRFSAQMAHDLKTPLAALKGGIQYLVKEVSRGGTLREEGQFLTLLVQQVDRLNGVVDGYARLGREQPEMALADLNELVRSVLALQRFVRSDVAIELDLEQDLPRCRLDADLVGRAVDNLVRNSVEAMPQGGRLTVRTSAARARDRIVGAVVIVQDTGIGMDSRVSARAFDDFFTTKRDGSGLGLAFIKRVMQAHSGRVHLTSKLGAGTSVALRFLVDREEHIHGRDRILSGGR